MFVIDAFNKDAQTAGEWVEFGGAEFLIAYSQNPAFIKTLRTLTKPFKRQIEKGTMDDAKVDELMCQAMADALLLDWKGVQFDAGGEETAYTKELAKKALILNPELREFVSKFSEELDNFRKKDIEEVSKK